MKNTNTTEPSQSETTDTAANTAANTIATRMVSVMRDITAIAKDSRNQQQGFNFRGIDSCYNELHGLLAKHGITTPPVEVSTKSEERTNTKGTVLRFVTATVTYRFLAADGSYFDAIAVGEGMDSGDKATSKALAIAHKYLLLQTFLIPTEEQKDPDYETHEVMPEQKVQQTTPPPPVDYFQKLMAKMFDDDISDAHIIEFLIANKAIKDRNVFIADLPVKVIKRLTEAWDKVKDFKPVTE